MSRTIRRRDQQHEYSWVLRDWKRYFNEGLQFRYEPNSKEGRRAVAIFHSDKSVTMGDAAPRWYRKKYDHMRRTRNNRVMKLWLSGVDFDPVFEASHKHEANYTWW
jgi:hypothetical protein